MSAKKKIDVFKLPEVQEIISNNELIVKNYKEMITYQKMLIENYEWKVKRDKEELRNLRKTYSYLMN